MKNGKLLVIGGVVAVLVICAFLFMGGGSDTPGAGKITDKYASAREAIAKGQPEKAVEILKPMVEESDDPAGWLLLGDAYVSIETLDLPVGDRYHAMEAYANGAYLGDFESLKRCIWFMSPFKIYTELVHYNKQLLPGYITKDELQEREKAASALTDPKAKDRALWVNLLIKVSVPDANAIQLRWLMLAEDRINKINNKYRDARMQAMLNNEEPPAIDEEDLRQVDELVLMLLGQLYGMDMLDDGGLSRLRGFNHNINAILKVLKSNSALDPEVQEELYKRGMERNDPFAYGAKAAGMLIDLPQNPVLPEAQEGLEEVVAEAMPLIEKGIAGGDVLSLYALQDLTLRQQIKMGVPNPKINKEELGKQFGVPLYKALREVGRSPYAICGDPLYIQYACLPKEEFESICTMIEKSTYPGTNKTWKSVKDKLQDSRWEHPVSFKSAVLVSDSVVLSGTYNGEPIEIGFPIYLNSLTGEWNLVQGRGIIVSKVDKPIEDFESFVDVSQDAFSGKEGQADKLLPWIQETLGIKK